MRRILSRKLAVPAAAIGLTGCLAGVLLTSASDVTLTGVSGDFYGQSVIGIVPLDNNSSKDIAVGASDANTVHMYHRLFVPGLGFTTSQFASFVGDPGGEAGWSLSWGSIGGQASRDLLIGAPSERNGKGQVHVIDGKSVTQSSLDATDAIITFRGSVNNEYLGWDSTTGDFNGDGERDVALGACGWGASPAFQGRIYIFHGPISPGVNNVNNADVVISGSTTGPEGEHLGCSLSAADLDNDGDQELLAGAHFTGPTFGGRVYLFDNPTSGNAAAVAARTFSGTGNFGYFGYDVDGGLDLNGDGVDDFVVGSPAARCVVLPNDSACTPGGAQAKRLGAAYVFYGSNGSLPASASDSAADVIINAKTNDTRFGNRLSLQADINGDGFAEFNVTEPLANRFLLFYGTDNLTSGTQLTTSNYGVNFDDSGNERIPTAVGRSGDFNQDGSRDVLFSSGRGFFDSAPNAGRVHLFYGEP